MFRFAVLLSLLAACSAHLVHGPVLAPEVAQVGPYLHGYGHGFHGYGDLGLLGHGYIEHVGHHILKRSPHHFAASTLGHLGAVGHIGELGYVTPVAHVAPFSPVADIAAVSPVAVYHQSRVDIRHSPLITAPVVPVVKPLLAPVLHAGPLSYGAGHYGIGHYGSAYSHLGHY